MARRVSIFAILCLANSCVGVPVQVKFEKPELPNGSPQLLNATDTALKTSRSARKCPDNSCFWPKNSAGIVNIPYIMDSYSDKDATAITEAMKDYIPMTCIRFVPRKREYDFLNISPQDGCWAYMGRKKGSQAVSMDHNCMTKGKIQHKLNHALGFHHEQSRSDRDDYVQILLQFVDKGYQNRGQRPYYLQYPCGWNTSSWKMKMFFLRQNSL